MTLTEKKCSVCHKFSWDSMTGIYNETHEDPVTKKQVRCDTNGPVYVDGKLQR